MDEVKIKNRLFIVGTPRSGTSILQKFISNHPNIYSLPETHFFHNVDHRYRKYLGIGSKKGLEHLKKILKSINKEKYIEEMGIFNLFYKNMVNKFVNILDEITIEKGKDIWLEKTPIHLHHIKNIEKYVKNSKFIHIIRNGEDVVASLYKVTQEYPEEWGGKRSIKRCINRWNKDIKITYKYRNNKKHIIIDYENFVDNHKEIGKKIFKFIGLDYKEKYFKNSENDGRDLVLKEEKWKKNISNNIKKPENRKFDKFFTEKEKKYIRKNLYLKRYLQIIKDL